MKREFSSEHRMDQEDILLAHKYRLSLANSPSQSSFRVVAVVFLETSNEATLRPDADIPVAKPLMRAGDNRIFVVGTNDEPGYIGGSICAERAALASLRFLPNVKVTRIVIATDSENPISPGMMCREFMAGHSQVPWDVDILLAGSICQACGFSINEVHQLKEPCPNQHDSGSFRHHQFAQTRTTLRDLYPHPSPFSRLPAGEAVQAGKQFHSRMLSTNNDSDVVKNTADLLALPGNERHHRLLQMARLAAKNDNRPELHPMQFGAAVLFSNGSFDTAYQKKALEYPCTLDAVSQLATKIEDELSKSDGSVRPVLIVQSDQYGIAHAPFASARAFLSEHGYGDCHVLVHKFANESAITKGLTSELASVPVSQLAPSAPEMGQLWVE